MNPAPEDAAWNMVETLSWNGLTVPPLGAISPSDIQKFNDWHWGSHDLDIARIYGGNGEPIVNHLLQHGPAFLLNYMRRLLTLVTTSPTREVAVWLQQGFGSHPMVTDPDDQGDRGRMYVSFHEIAQHWASLAEAGRASDRVRWLAYNSDGSCGVIDLDALRDGADLEAACEELDRDQPMREILALCTPVDPKGGGTGESASGDVAGRGSRSPEADPPPINSVVPHLAEALRRLADDSHLVISVHGSTRYVQFATFRPNLRLETIGTRYLDDAGEAWSVDEVVWLAEHDWHDADDDGNLWRDWIPADENAAAQAAIDALTKVHGVTSLDQVWFQAKDDNALAALEGAAPGNDDSPDRHGPPEGLQPTTPERAAEINAVLEAALRKDAEGVEDMPAGTTYLVIADYVDRNAVLELLAFDDGKIFRRHDGRWHMDPAWIRALEKAPAKSVVLLTADQLEQVRPKVDASTHGQPWKKFDPSRLEMYWPSYRPNDPHMFDPSQLVRPPTGDPDRSATVDDDSSPDETAQPAAHPMFEVLTGAGIVVPHLGCSDPADIEGFGDWHWGTRELDRTDLYLFNVESIARDLAEHGPVFALSHGGHGANSHALTLLSTSPRRDATFLTQSGFGGAYANEDADLQRINDTYHQLEQEWVDFGAGRPRDEIYWLAYASPMRSTSGFVNLSALRRTGSFERANTRLDTDVAGVFDVLRRRLAFNPARFLNISSHLKVALRRLRPGTHLTIGVRGSNRCIRLSQSGPTLLLETTGMHYPEPDGGALTAEQMQWLVEEGWHYKDYGTDGPELRRELKAADHSEAVRIVLEVLRKAYDVQALEELWFGCPDETVLAAIAEHPDALQLRKE